MLAVPEGFGLCWLSSGSTGDVLRHTPALVALGQAFGAGSRHGRSHHHVEPGARCIDGGSCGFVGRYAVSACPPARSYPIVCTLHALVWEKSKIKLSFSTRPEAEVENILL